MIGIGGVSNAGKSELAQRLSDYFTDQSVEIFCQDDYVLPKDKLPLINGHIDWENPETVDFKRYRNAIANSMKIKDVVISEGLFGFYDSELNKMMNIKLFMFLDYHQFYRRKKLDLRWGVEPDWYIRHIYDSYIRYSQSYPEDAYPIDASRAIDDKFIRIVVMSEIYSNIENDL